jgi:AcrR family transcriptional regulator
MEIRDRIKQKAEELYMKYGIRSVSMDDIAAQLGMSKKTIYQYFADKDELVDAVVEEEINHMQDDCMQCTRKAQNAIDEIFITLDAVMDQFSNMNPMLLHDMEKFHHKAYQRFRKHKIEFLLKIIHSNLERGIREGLFRPELNLEVISKFRLESMMIAFDVNLFPASRYTLAGVTKEIIEHYLYGVASLKGHKLILQYMTERKNNQQ